MDIEGDHNDTVGQPDYDDLEDEEQPGGQRDGQPPASSAEEDDSTLYYEKVDDYPVMDPNILPFNLRSQCLNKPIFWLERTTKHGRCRLSTILVLCFSDDCCLNSPVKILKYLKQIATEIILVANSSECC